MKETKKEDCPCGYGICDECCCGENPDLEDIPEEISPADGKERV